MCFVALFRPAGEAPIRLLHTADWHLGHEMMGWARDNEHAFILDEIARLVVANDVDALIIAGDVFDHQNPSGAMTRQLFAFFDRLADEAPWLTTVMIAGNHDSAGRMDAPGPLLLRANVHAVGALENDGGALALSRHLVKIERQQKLLGYILAIPYLRPADLPGSDQLLKPGKSSPIATGIKQLYGDFINPSRKKAGALPLVVTGHLHVKGASLSESISERHILIGGEHAVPAGIFGAKADYVALGHLHRAQSLGPKTARDRVRYAGSPLPLSAVERTYEHGVSLVEVQKGKVQLQHLPLPRPVAFLRVPETGRLLIDELEDALEALELDAELPQSGWPFVQVCLRTEGPTPGLRGRLDEICARFPVRDVSPDIERPARNSAKGREAPLKRLAEHSPEQLFRQAFEERHDSPPDKAHLRCFAQLLDEAQE